MGAVPQERGERRLLRSIEALQETTEKCTNSRVIVLLGWWFGECDQENIQGGSEMGTVERQAIIF